MSMGRGQGKTTWGCQCIAGCVGLGQTPIFAVVPEMRWADHIWPILRRILEEQGIEAKRNGRSEVTAGGSTVRFVPYQMLERSICGYLSASVVDFTWETRRAGK